MPKDDDVVAERADCPTVGRHGVVGEVSGDDLRQPAPGFGDRLVQPLSQSLLDFSQPRGHAVPSGLSRHEKAAPSGFTTDEHEAEELEGFRLAKTAPSSVRRRIGGRIR